MECERRATANATHVLLIKTKHSNEMSSLVLPVSRTVIQTVVLFQLGNKY